MIRVLLVDDHAVLRDGLRYLLEAQPNIKVIGDAADGRTAVDLAGQLEPDVVVMDVSMPELNGLDATAAITERVQGTRVIILSVLGSAEHIYQALRAGAMGYLLKESAGKELVQAIQAVHEGRRYLGPKVAETLIGDYLDHRPVQPGASPLDRLSRREREIMQLVIEGKSSAEIGELLFLSPKTVETYRSRL